MDLVAFLRQRLDDDQRVAEAADHGTCWYDCDEGHGDHHQRWDPARVLRDVEGGRRLIEQYEAMRAGAEAAAGTILAGAAKVRLGAYEFALKCRALPFADHPDYDESWRP